MASFGQTFDASSVEPSSSYDVLPPGKYLGQIVASEMRPTKDGTGQYLYLEVDILEGQYAGRKLFDRLNLVNANPDTVEIAKRTLSSICRAVGKMQVSNSEQLHLIPMTLDVRVRPPKGLYGESNSIRYLPRATSGATSGATPVASTPAFLQPPQAEAARSIAAAPTMTPAANGLPWKRHA
jgi:hypothetical protein